MQFATSSALIATAYFALSAQALPRPQASPSYSVVDVDGGVSAAASSPTTIYQTITESFGAQPTAETTVSVTVVETPSGSSTTVTFGSETTIFSTISAAAQSDPTTVSVPGVYSIEIEPSPSANTSTSASTSAIATGIAAATVTVVSISTDGPSQTSASDYDNGMWHTYYPVKGPEFTHPPHKPHFTQPSVWNNTNEDIHPRAPAASGTGARLYPRIAPSGTGVSHAKRVVAATGTGSLAGRAAPTGFSVVSWNETKQW